MLFIAERVAELAVIPPKESPSLCAIAIVLNTAKTATSVTVVFMVVIFPLLTIKIT
jgi:hypothetical protein